MGHFSAQSESFLSLIHPPIPTNSAHVRRSRADDSRHVIILVLDPRFILSQMASCDVAIPPLGPRGRRVRLGEPSIGDHYDGAVHVEIESITLSGSSYLSVKRETERGQPGLIGSSLHRPTMRKQSQADETPRIRYVGCKQAEPVGRVWTAYESFTRTKTPYTTHPRRWFTGYDGREASSARAYAARRACTSLLSVAVPSSSL